MHPSEAPAERRPGRRASSSCIAFVYWFLPTLGGWHVDYAGVDDARSRSGVAMAMMAYVLVAGSRE